MTTNRKSKSVRLPDEIWNLIEKVGKKEGWSNSITVQEMAKFYGREKGISAIEKETE